jgi:3',5'-cyclic-AMP phosphodiesterase
MKRIAFLTDVHLDERFPVDNNVNPQKNLERVISDLSNRNIDEIIFGGDIGAATSHLIFFNALKPFKVNLILGNHDKFKEVSNYYIQDKEKNELYYTFEDVNYKYIFLDTSSDELSKAQLEWLRIEVKTTKKLILFIHHPIIEIETPIDKLYPLKNRELIKPILIESGNIVTIFCGHYHMNDESTYKNIRQITTQSLSFQIVKDAGELKIDNSQFGYRIIEIESDRIKTELINFN